MRATMAADARSACRQPRPAPVSTPKSAITPSPVYWLAMPPGVGDGPSHRLEVAIEEEYDIIGQPVLGQPGEAAEIGEEHGDLPLLAVDALPLAGRRARADSDAGEERCHRDDRGRA